VSDTAIRKRPSLGWERDLSEAESAKRFAASWFAARFATTIARTASQDAEIIEEAAEEGARLVAATAATFARPRTLRTC
jgi:hypothetical protein